MKEELQLSNKHNYSQYSNKRRDVETEKPVAPKVEENVATEEVKMVVERSETAAAPVVKSEPVKPIETVAPVEPVKPILVEETVETTPLPETVHGVVVNCSKLNVRAEPSMFADVVCVLDAASEIEIDITKSNNEWFKIYTTIGAEGYCMRKFINAYL